jgi:hypothetical protein
MLFVQIEREMCLRWNVEGYVCGWGIFFLGETLWGMNTLMVLSRALLERHLEEGKGAVTRS